MSKESKRTQVQAEIAEAFYGIVYPEDGRILSSGEDYFDLEDFLDTTLSHCSWRDIPLGIMEKKKNSSILCFGTPQFYRWIIPAYMTYTLEFLLNTETPDVSLVLMEQTVSEISCDVISYLEDEYSQTPSEENKNHLIESRNHTIRHRSLLSQEQKLTFKSFLEFIVVYSDDESSRDYAYMAIKKQYYLL
ncbi:MAG: hypothetical protein LBJ67_01530 [Planctomycetaceae bacterium]|jgi:hypothetical protein|nr:hypothetical protein [Planctomycetaceae bacterium]